MPRYSGSVESVFRSGTEVTRQLKPLHMFIDMEESKRGAKQDKVSVILSAPEGLDKEGIPLDHRQLGDRLVVRIDDKKVAQKLQELGEFELRNSKLDGPESRFTNSIYLERNDTTDAVWQVSYYDPSVRRVNILLKPITLVTEK